MKRGLDNIEAWLTLVEQIYLEHKQDIQPKITQWIETRNDEKQTRNTETKESKENEKKQQKNPGT